MTHGELEKAYKQFFDSEAGKYFLTELERLIDTSHKDAENSPELARDFVQRAKGTRSVLNHITGMQIEIKKGRSMKPQIA